MYDTIITHVIFTYMTGFFQNILGNLFGGVKDNSAIGVDIGSGAIKVVQLSRMDNGDIKLDTYGALALGPYQDKIIGQATNLSVDTRVEALTDLLREAQTTTTNGGIAIPFSSTLMSVITLPNIPEEELGKMVPIEAKKYVPVSMSEVSLDWIIIPDTEQSGVDNRGHAQEKISVLVVAIHNTVINQYQSIISKAELDTLFFEVEIFSTIRAVMPDIDDPVMILDMGADTTKVYIVERGIVRSTHTINKGSQDITKDIEDKLHVNTESAEMLKRGMDPDPESQDRSKDVVNASLPIVDHILSESIQFQKNFEHNTKKIHKAILVGGGVQLHGFSQTASDRLDISVERGHPFDQIKSPDFLDEVLARSGPEFTVATGIAMRKLEGK